MGHNVFELWKQAWNMYHPEDPVSEDLLVTFNLVLLNTNLSKFDVEVRKANGEIYPPATKHLLQYIQLQYSYCERNHSLAV